MVRARAVQEFKLVRNSRYKGSSGSMTVATDSKGKSGTYIPKPSWYFESDRHTDQSN
jgi:hypothetical protein